MEHAPFGTQRFDARAGRVLPVRSCGSEYHPPLHCFTTNTGRSHRACDLRRLRALHFRLRNRSRHAPAGHPQSLAHPFPRHPPRPTHRHGPARTAHRKNHRQAVISLVYYPRMSKSLSLILLLFCLVTPFSAQTTADDYNAIFKPLKWRSIGPFRGGRSVAGTGVIGDPKTYYMGTTGGGLWKTEDMGISWRNISDGYFKTGTVGAIAVAPNDPNVVYVGMGEHAVRGVMTSSGDGVYRSTDAGKTWKHIGLGESRHVSRIVVNPKNPDVVLVAAQGALYAPSQERGVFKSTDGGGSWKRVLFVDEK